MDYRVNPASPISFVYDQNNLVLAFIAYGAIEI